MKKILYTSWEWTDSGELVRLHSLYTTYSGPWILAKKGRKIMKQNALADQAEAKAARGREAAQYDVANKLEGEEVAGTTPGSLSPAATARLASDRDQIANTYNGIRQTAFRTLGQRGFGSAPSGFGLAAENAADLGEATQDTAAYRNAQQETQREREHAMGTAAGLTGQQGGIGTGASGASTNSAVALNKAGSTFGDIMGGIAQAAPIIAAPFTGGASLMASGLFGGTNPFSRMGRKPSSIGGYGPGPDGTYSQVG